MKTKQSPRQKHQMKRFSIELVKIISKRHSLVKLSQAIDWGRLDKEFGAVYCPENGQPAISTRLMAALHYLKYMYNLSDHKVISEWQENPYWQYFSGMKWFEHEVPLCPSSMKSWRQYIRESGAQLLLAETIAAGMKLKAGGFPSVGGEETAQERAGFQ